MSTYLALDKDTGDLILKEGGGVERVDKARFTIQQTRSRLRTWLGEWFLDRNIGWLSTEDFERNPNLADLERRAREIILTTKDVKEIKVFNLRLQDRTLIIYFLAETTYGEIELTVPWGVLNGRSN